MMRCQGLIRGLETFEDAIQAVIAWHQSITAAIEEACEELRRVADALLPSDASISLTKLNVAAAKADFGAFHLSGRSAGKKALRSNAGAVHSQVRWPTRPEDQFMVDKIYKLLMKALTADDIWEAMEYLMAVRGLLKTTVATVSEH